MDPTFVEYDLDAEDEAWLTEFNGEQERLSADKFETMLWRLDVSNAEATDRIYAFGGMYWLYYRDCFVTLLKINKCLRSLLVGFLGKPPK